MKNITPIGIPRFHTNPGSSISEAASQIVEFCKEYNTEAEVVFNNITLGANPMMESQSVIDNYYWKKDQFKG